MGNFLETAVWILISSVKYILVIITFLSQSSRFWLTDMIIVFVGGSLGVVVFTFFGTLISKFFKKFNLFKIRYKNLKRFISIKQGYGLIGIAFLTPLILGIPLGSILASLFESNKKRVIRLQLTSVAIWSIFLFGIKGLIQYWI